MPRGFMRRQKPSWQQKPRVIGPVRPKSSGGGRGRGGGKWIPQGSGPEKQAARREVHPAPAVPPSDEAAGPGVLEPQGQKDKLQKEKTMSGLEKEFQAAAAESRQLKNRPSDSDLLKLYALYKQATVGDVSGPPPGFGDFVGEAKHEAWAKLKGMPGETAMRNYVDLVQVLKKA